MSGSLRAARHCIFTRRGAPPERADFSSFRPKFHVLERKSQTFKQSAQKDGAKFGGDAFDRSRKDIFEKQQSKLKRTINIKCKFK